jgi:phage terminase large subunit-like protein
VSEGLLLTDDEIGELLEDERAEYLAILEEERAATAHLAWRAKARPEQLPPAGEWSTLFLRGGRGSGKSYAGAHILSELIAEDPLRVTEGPGQWAIVAPTFGDARDKCVESDESGLLMALGTNVAEVAAGRSSLVAKWNRSMGELELRDGTRVYIDGGDDGAYRCQGYNLRGAWCDEVGLWKQWKAAWDESLGFALRKGQARRVATGTPKRDQPARELIKRLLADDRVISRRLRTADNAHNLSPAFFDSVAQYAGTALGRQELEGELLDEVVGALWRLEWIEDHRVESVPVPLRRTVVALDPSDGTADGDEQGICAAAVGLDGELYVLRSEGHRTTPLRWLERALRMARDLEASLVIEKNFGGLALRDLLEQAIQNSGIRAPYSVIDAHRSKLARAEIVAALYETGRVHHVGAHQELEEQMLSWAAAPGQRSPDRMDAAVHALRELMSYARRPGTAGDALNAAVPYRVAAPNQEGAAVPWEGGFYSPSWSPAGYSEPELDAAVRALGERLPRSDDPSAGAGRT